LSKEKDIIMCDACNNYFFSYQGETVCPECLDLIELGREYKKILRAKDKEGSNVTKRDN